MYKLKTQLNTKSVSEFIDSIENEKRRNDSITLINIMKKITNFEPKMWGDSIIGYGNSTYTNSSKKTYNWFEVGFSPRKNALTLYLTAYSKYIFQLSDEMGLSYGKGCVYIPDINKIDLQLLRRMIEYTFTASE